LDAIFTRRSVRAYTGQQLDKPTVQALLDAAVQAPTAIHLEPCAFVVLQDSVTLKRLSDLAKSMWARELSHERSLHTIGEAIRARLADEMANPDMSLFYDAGTLIVICAKPLGPFAVADCWLAAENLMLAACAMGLGSCCIGSAVSALNSPGIKRELAIPEDVVAVAPIVVGVPRAEPVGPVERKTPEVLYWR
jgi:nitroreductase